MLKVNLKTKEVTREPLPKFLIGLDQKDLNDLSKFDPALGVQDFGFWVEVNDAVVLPEYNRYTGVETYVLDEVNFKVIVSRVYEPITTEELEKTLSDEAEVRYKEAIKLVDTLLDNSAKSRGYDNIISECSMASSTGVSGASCQITVNWRDAIWVKMKAMKDDVIAGGVEPTYDEMFEALPKRDEARFAIVNSSIVDETPIEVASWDYASLISITTKKPHGLSVGQQIFVTGLIGTNSPNGEWVVDAIISDTSFSFAAIDEPSGIPEPDNGLVVGGKLAEVVNVVLPKLRLSGSGEQYRLNGTNIIHLIDKDIHNMYNQTNGETTLPYNGEVDLSLSLLTKHNPTVSGRIVVDILKNGVSIIALNITNSVGQTFVRSREQLEFDVKANDVITFKMGIFDPDNVLFFGTYGDAPYVVAAIKYTELH